MPSKKKGLNPMPSINKQTIIQGLGSIQHSYFEFFLSSLFLTFHNAASGQMSHIVFFVPLETIFWRRSSGHICFGVPIIKLQTLKVIMWEWKKPTFYIPLIQYIIMPYLMIIGYAYGIPMMLRKLELSGLLSCNYELSMPVNSKIMHCGRLTKLS